MYGKVLAMTQLVINITAVPKDLRERALPLLVEAVGNEKYLVSSLDGDVLTIRVADMEEPWLCSSYRWEKSNVIEGVSIPLHRQGYKGYLWSDYLNHLDVDEYRARVISTMGMLYAKKGSYICYAQYSSEHLTDWSSLRDRVKNTLYRGWMFQEVQLSNSKTTWDTTTTESYSNLFLIFAYLQRRLAYITQKDRNASPTSASAKVSFNLGGGRSVTYDFNPHKDYVEELHAKNGRDGNCFKVTRPSEMEASLREFRQQILSDLQQPLPKHLALALAIAHYGSHAPYTNADDAAVASYAVLESIHGVSLRDSQVWVHLLRALPAAGPGFYLQVDNLRPGLCNPLAAHVSWQAGGLAFTDADGAALAQYPTLPSAELQEVGHLGVVFRVKREGAWQRDAGPAPLSGYTVDLRAGRVCCNAYYGASAAGRVWVWWEASGDDAYVRGLCASVPPDKWRHGTAPPPAPPPAAPSPAAE